MHSRNLSVNTADRNDVIAFWHAIYQASEDYDKREVYRSHATAGYYAADFTTASPYLKANGVPSAGELHPTFIKDVERRVNFHRAMAGVLGNIAMQDSAITNNTALVYPPSAATVHEPPAGTTKALAAQQSAYLATRTMFDNKSTNGMEHNLVNPSTSQLYTTLSGFTKPAFNGNANSNLTLGLYGPGAINSYASDEIAGTNGANLSVGHRQWLLASNATNFATGDTVGNIAGSAVRQSSNALYVAQNTSETIPPQQQFTAYPSGFFPAQLNSKYWSISHPNANFDNATISVRNASGGGIGTGNRIVDYSLVHPTLVWQVSSSAAIKTVAQDTVFNVTISNIGGVGVPSTYSYSVRLINPDVLTSPQDLSGTASPPSASSAAYLFTPPPGAEAIQVNTFKQSSTTWVETAEAASEYITDDTYGTYDFLSSAISGFPMVSGAKSFRLTQPSGYDPAVGTVIEQSFMLGREIIPGNNGALTFKYKQGYMGTGNSLVVEATNNSGQTWTQLGSQITGVASPSNSAITWTGTFAASTTPYQVRFRYYKSGASTYSHQANPTIATGIFIDDITTTNCTWLERKKTNELSGTATRFLFNAASAGEAGATMPNGTQYILRMRTRLGNRWFAYGPGEVVTATNNPLGGILGWLEYEVPELLGNILGDQDGDGISNLLEYAFSLDPFTKDYWQDTVTITAPNTALEAESGQKDSGQESATKDTIGLGLISISRPLSSAKSGVNYSAEWSETMAPGSWSSSGVTVVFANGKVTASAPAASAKRFIRWKVTAQ